MRALATSALIAVLVCPALSHARDPYPRKERTKYLVSLPEAEDASPQTMLRADGQRSGPIAFHCKDPDDKSSAEPTALPSPAIDTLIKASAECAKIKNGAGSAYFAVNPYLKNNKDVAPTDVTYDANKYDWPAGDFITSQNHLRRWTWVTPIVYGSVFRQVHHKYCPTGVCGASCQFMTNGPQGYLQENDTDVLIKRVVDSSTNPPTYEYCISPPYSYVDITTWPPPSGDAWWNWLAGQLANKKASLPLDDISAVQAYLGIDGEARAYKSDEPWTLADVSECGSPCPNQGSNPLANYPKYAVAVFKMLRHLYPDKTLRAHFDGNDLSPYLANGVDLHWESVNPDEDQAYWFLGFNPFGWHQVFAEHFWMTNTVGINPAATGTGGNDYQTFIGMLAKHGDGITGVSLHHVYQEGRGDFLKFLGSHIGKNINETPSVWISLRDTIYPRGYEVPSHPANFSFSGRYGDHDFYLYRPELLPGNATVTVNSRNLPAGTSDQLYNKDLTATSVAWGIIGRRNAANNHYMSFDVDDGYRYAGVLPRAGVSIDFRIVYLDDTPNPFELQYKDATGAWVHRVIQRGTPGGPTYLWAEVTVNATDAYLNNTASEGTDADKYPTDFRLWDGGKSALTVHMVEVTGNGSVQDCGRPKAQVSCDMVPATTPPPDPLEGIYSVGVGQKVLVTARLTDDADQPLAGERVMFTYSTEWGWAQSVKSDDQGIATFTLDTRNTANDPSPRSGFEGAKWDGSPSWYGVQVYYPGGRRFQPSRNDCRLLVTSTNSPTNPSNTRLKIVKKPDPSAGALDVTYQILDVAGALVEAKTERIDWSKGFYLEDPNAQTIALTWGPTATRFASFNNLTLRGLRMDGGWPDPDPACRPAEDAGNPDGGQEPPVLDGGDEGDAGQLAQVGDAGATDGGRRADAGRAADAGMSAAASGCGCVASGQAAWAIAPLLMSLLAVRRRRRPAP